MNLNLVLNLQFTPTFLLVPWFTQSVQSDFSIGDRFMDFIAKTSNKIWQQFFFDSWTIISGWSRGSCKTVCWICSCRCSHHSYTCVHFGVGCRMVLVCKYIQQLLTMCMSHGHFNRVPHGLRKGIPQNFWNKVTAEIFFSCTASYLLGLDFAVK